MSLIDSIFTSIASFFQFKNKNFKLDRLAQIDFLKEFVNEMNGKADNVKIRAFNALNANKSNPFLNAISAGFVERFIVFDIIQNFVVRQFLEKNFCSMVNGFLKICSLNGHGSNHVVRFSA